MGGAEPRLALETESGRLDSVPLSRLVAAFPGSAIPRLLFLSACHSGEDSPDIDSLARRLVAAGFPAVLGWADAVYDSDAAAFAAAFYGVLARRHAGVEDAWATARFELLNRGGKAPPRHWHLARLLLGPGGGGALSGGRAPRTSALTRTKGGNDFWTRDNRRLKWRAGSSSSAGAARSRWPCARSATSSRPACSSTASAARASRASPPASSTGSGGSGSRSCSSSAATEARC